MSIVIDASVFCKLFLKEPDSGAARAFFLAAIENNARLLAPGLLVYEVMQTAHDRQAPLSEPERFLRLHRAANLTIVEPNAMHWKKAAEIAGHGHPKSGYPTLYDSIYHALALCEGGQFLTADGKHAAKAKRFGALTVLKDWEGLL